MITCQLGTGQNITLLQLTWGKVIIEVKIYFIYSNILRKSVTKPSTIIEYYSTIEYYKMAAAEISSVSNWTFNLTSSTGLQDAYGHEYNICIKQDIL